MLSVKNIFKKRVKHEVSTLYTNCEMPLWNMTQYLKTRDLKYFTANLLNIDGTQEAMEAIFMEFAELTNNNSILTGINTIFKILRLEAKYTDVTNLVSAIYNFDPELPREALLELTGQVQKWGYKMNFETPLFEQLEAISNRVQNLKTQIAVLEESLEKDGENDVETSKIESQLLNVERILGLKRSINQKETTLYEWAELQNQSLKSMPKT